MYTKLGVIGGIEVEGRMELRRNRSLDLAATSLPCRRREKFRTLAALAALLVHLVLPVAAILQPKHAALNHVEKTSLEETQNLHQPGQSVFFNTSSFIAAATPWPNFSPHDQLRPRRSRLIKTPSQSRRPNDLCGTPREISPALYGTLSLLHSITILKQLLLPQDTSIHYSTKQT